MTNNIIDDFYNYYIKWDKENFNKYYNNIDEYKKSYLKIINNDPYSLYEYVISLYNDVLFNKNLNDDITVKQFNDINKLLFKTAKFIRNINTSK